ncbi:hypothetical protein [Dyadobacter frigoris]|uniref:Uncharacterized protein n=1 Tax=Dyadobacter frigoris TaxID=2576211 RepID=A0A4U6D6P8_9BACT|nr:hypothetical protein [Dyadobacter frigoris]TKT92396.1 hypothetical protein FDK13_10500 [Dyadobacter frigoris]GLU53585.1 hypothetical protein Dfri01_30460 [Dyadobacter frigoris]
MEKYIKCRHQNGFFIFDTVEKYPEDIANDILEEFINQDLEAITYKIADDHSFQVTGRIREQYVKLILDEEGNDPVLVKMNTIKSILEYKIKELV